MARRINLLRETRWKLVAEKFGAQGAKALRVVEHLYAKPVVTVNGVKDLLGVSYENANLLVQRLAGQGILRKITGQRRNRHFLYAPYIALFSDL